MKGIMTYFWGRLSCHNSSFSFKMIALIGNTAAHRSTCSSQFSNGVLIFTFLIIKAIQHMSEGSSLLNYINTLWRLDCSWAWTGSVESSNCVWELVSTMCWAQGFTIVWTISAVGAWGLVQLQQEIRGTYISQQHWAQVNNKLSYFNSSSYRLVAVSLALLETS